jgi:flagellar biosynthesis protein FlhA
MAIATNTQNSFASATSILKSPDIQFAVAMICIMFMLFMPLPPFLLDILLSISITLGFLVLLIAIYIKEPLEFSTFPTFLLISTLYRLALNVATTRNILLDGYSGHISQVIASFGNFVVGGNYFVGTVIFLILVIINFVVITKGAGRVAEVAARFTLDAMPGKQMSIDADLNAGVIDREEAKKRRSKIEEEADFYGSMDGASKFVRGDAIAGIIITGINIIVGLMIGVTQHGMSFAHAAQVYTLLTIGDGLVAQIPAIITSVAAGIVVTRASGEEGLSETLVSQMFLKPKALYICCFLLLVMALLPGLPFVPFLLLAIALYFAGSRAQKTIATREETSQKKEQESEGSRKENSVEALLHLDCLTLEVGVGLIPLVDSNQNGEILERIVSTRKQFAQDLGIVVPMVMVRDNIQLKPGEYQLLLKGNKIAEGQLLPEYELAMAPDENPSKIEGIPTKEPAYGLDAVWITGNQREDAAFKGYTVVNCSTVIVTHLTKVIQENAENLLGRQEAQTLIERLKEKSPKVVEEVITNDGLTLGGVVKVLHNLLRENVSIRDMLSIFETLADHCKSIKNTDTLTRYVRKSLGRSIVKKLINSKGEVAVVSLDRGTEDLLLSGLQYHEDGSTTLKIDPEIAQRILGSMSQALQAFQKTDNVPVLLCGTQVRWDLKKMVDHFIPGVTVLAFDEIPIDIKTNSLGIVQI